MIFALALAAACSLVATGSEQVTRALPFAVGESLHYKLGWANFAHAADVQLDFVERRDLYGQPTMHFRAALHSFPPLRALFPVDDVFWAARGGAGGDARPSRRTLRDADTRLDENAELSRVDV